MNEPLLGIIRTTTEGKTPTQVAHGNVGDQYIGKNKPPRTAHKKRHHRATDQKPHPHPEGEFHIVASGNLRRSKSIGERS